MNSVERLLVNLRILSQVQPFQRINTKSEFLGIEAISWHSPVSRWFRSDDREACMRRLAELINEAGTTLSENKAAEIDGVKNWLQNSKGGVNNLTKTYESDATTVAQLQHLIEKIDNLLGNSPIYNKRIPNDEKRD